MKAGISELSEIKKRLDVEIPADTVDAAIDRMARQHGRRARVSGFRPGKVPMRVVRQRFKQDILHDVAHDLVPPAVDEALREHAMTPVDTPDVRDISIDEGQPLTFHALFEVMPSIVELDYEALTLRRTPITPDAEAEARALEDLRLRAARLVPVTDHPLEHGEFVTVDLTRSDLPTGQTRPSPSEHREDVTIELGEAGNPPGFDDELIGLKVGDTKAFEVTYPDDHKDTSMAGTRTSYEVTVKAHHYRVLPEVDDDFAQSIGEFDTLEALKDRIATDLRREAEIETNRGVRRDLLRQLTGRVTVEVPDALVEREVTRRLERVATRLAQQRIDPRTANLDWNALREEQRPGAVEAVRGSLVLDEVARRESLTVSNQDIEQEVIRYAERLGQTPTAVRAQMDKDGGLGQLTEGLRREKAIDLLLSRATIITA
ncbi:MAG: trigger factor [Acidobacteriota bacterium]|nr:trigger factor [Acidobacteriota bacterium]